MRTYVRDFLWLAGIVAALIVYLPIEGVRWALGR